MTETPELFSTAPPSFLERLWQSSERQSYWITRFFILRLLGLVYLVGFLVALDQGLPLLGSDGLTPATDYLGRIEERLGPTRAFLEVPTIFWRGSTDEFLMRVAGVGVVLSAVVLFGYANAISLVLLWFLYLSIVHVGQDWYAFGWEIQLLETGFLAIFLCSLLDGRPFPSRPPPVVVIWLYRWLIFRIMLGAGLIKFRGDPCWRELTCLAYHFETQPVPSPLSAWLHFMPGWFHRLGVIVNHLCELVVPFFVFGPRRFRHVAGVCLVSFQVLLIASGNLSFLNWLTIVPALACFDDSFWARLLPAGFTRWALSRRGAPLAFGQRVAAAALAVLVAISSIAPVANMLSRRQIMNTSFTRLHLVNTYGAFGSVGRERLELVIEGTMDDPSDGADWRAYELPCKPTAVERRPCIITPYHYRLDWLLWFAAMGSPRQYPWTIHLVWKLLHNDERVVDLLAENPFPDEPPRFVRIDLYRYHFAPLSDENWWRRERLGSWLPAMSVGDPRLREALQSYGWLD